MATNRGKDFEEVVKDSFLRVPDTSVVRLPDPVQGYLGIRNISDFIVYHYPYQYFIECKSVHGDRFSIHSGDPKRRYGLITNNQWNGMSEQSKLNGVKAGVIVWFIDHDITRYLPIASLQVLYDNNVKSIKYDFTSIPHIDIEGSKKRVFFDYCMYDFFRRVEHGEDS